MQRVGKVPDDKIKQAQKQVLDRLIDQELLVQQALEKKLDRDPDVLLQLEAARRQILAQAFIQQVTGGIQKAPTDTIKGFYDEHPELFKERRVYRFAQMAIAAPPERQDAVRAKLEALDKSPDKGKILPQLAAWLKTENIPFRANQATQAAEQLPMEALSKYHKMAVGDILYQPGPQGIVIAQLIAAQTVPLSEEQATPFIEQYLQNRERLKLSDSEMKRLKDAAKIEYLGEFAAMAKAAPAPAAAPAEPAKPAEQAGGEQKDFMDQGIKGLK
jgi:EpsD family peptidyl-prolyl cis-trans isomerase